MTLLRWLPLLFLVIAGCALFIFGDDYFTLDAIQSHALAFKSYVEAHYILAVIIFSAVYVAAVAFSLPVATVLTLLGGYLFGRWFGTVYVVIAATAGATLVFLAARSSLGASLRKRAKGLHQKVGNNIRDNAVGYLLFLRLVPIFPFFIINILPALVNVSLRVFILTTFVGIIPGSFVYVNVGEAFTTIENTNDLLSPELIGAFVLLGLFILIPTIYRQLKSRKGSDHDLSI